MVNRDEHRQDTQDRNHPGAPADSAPAAVPPRRHMRRNLLVGAILLLMLGAGWYWYSQRGASAPGGAGAPGARMPGGPAGPGAFGPGGPGAGMPRSPVVVATAVRRDMDVTLNGLGNVTPVSNVTVRAQVSGPLLRVLFQEGQMVKAGDVLAEIDPRPFQATLDQAIGQLTRDQALLQNARIDQQRYRTLLGQDSIARQQVDTQDALVRQYEGTVKTDQANVDSAKLQVSYTRIKAPVSGRIGLRQVDAGNIVSTGDTNGVALITQVAPIAVLFAIPEDSLHPVLRQLKAGKTLEVQAWDRQARNQLATGKLLTTDNQIDTTTGTVRLKAVFENADGMLFPNQFVNVRMRVSTLADATVVPVAAIQRGQQGTFVYTVDERSQVKVQTVSVGPGDGERVSISKGLQPGQRVVVDGADRLREGMMVEAVDPTAREAAVAPASQPRARQRRPGGGHGAQGGANAVAPGASVPAADTSARAPANQSASAPASAPAGTPRQRTQ